MISPLILGFVVMSAIAGAVTNLLGYTNPAMLASAILSSVGAGLLTTFHLDTPASKWIGYQVLFGFGIGSGLQQPMMVVQTTLSQSDIPIGVSLISLFQMLSGSIFIAISQGIFQNTLSGLHQIFPRISTNSLLQSGATSLPMLFTRDELPIVFQVYRDAIRNTLYVSLALSCLSIVGACCVKWKSMKAKPSASESDVGVEENDLDEKSLPEKT
jgi:MFS family permease